MALPACGKPMRIKPHQTASIKEDFDRSALLLTRWRSAGGATLVVRAKIRSWQGLGHLIVIMLSKIRECCFIKIRERSQTLFRPPLPPSSHATFSNSTPQPHPLAAPAF